ncbi:Cytochrome c oxidase subunit VIb [Perkinsela sp. CCAP 1560/4]|nr:Cytochrome c oxidase subunit VIb [Perkinsela sp. CCAP 1560/4]|eukprot:KNH06940.1 Cytochrome c oxidase subunit VIb [Perkinsela sp. CCAP 1560/4]
MGKMFEQREHCYTARDAYFTCIDKPENYGRDDRCVSLERKYEEYCPESWRKYFQQQKDRENLVAIEAGERR